MNKVLIVETRRNRFSIGQKPVEKRTTPRVRAPAEKSLIEHVFGYQSKGTCIVEHAELIHRTFGSN